MKRKGLLLVTDCAASRFDTLAARDQLPFLTEGGKWSDYTLEDAAKLRLMLDAAEIVDVNTASMLARDSSHRLPASPLGWTGGRELWMGVAFYSWTDMPEDWDGRRTFGGRAEDLVPQAEAFVKDLGMPGATLHALVSVNATRAAHHVREAAREIGLPEWDKFPPLPPVEELPDWLATAARQHRELFDNWNNPDWEGNE